MHRERILVTVKTYPTLSKRYGETVCTAGVREDGTWIRLYPVPFRRLKEAQQYKKFDWIECDVERNTKDVRPETYRPADCEQMVPVGHIDTNDNWRKRKEILLGRCKVYTSLQTVIDGAKSNQISLAVFKPAKIIGMTSETEDPDWDPVKLARSTGTAVKNLSTTQSRSRK